MCTYTENVYKSLSIIYLSFMNGKWHLINQGACWAINKVRVYIRLYKLPTMCGMAQKINMKEQSKY